MDKFAKYCLNFVICMDTNIPLLKPFFTTDELDEIKNVLDSGWVSQGPEVNKFEQLAGEYIHSKGVIAVSNCTAALHLSLLALGIKQGDEVIVGDYSYPATAHAVAYCGARPRFVDIDPQTYNINPELVGEKINSKTKAIIPIHTFGQPCDMDEIIKISKDGDIKVIEDAACAFGSKYKDRYVGTLGDSGCFSFHARKGITTGEGGLVTTNNAELAKAVRKLSLFGMESAWEREGNPEFFIPRFDQLGYNYKMSDITAAVGVAQIKKLEDIIERKRQLARYYDEKLEAVDNIEAPFVSKDVEHVYQSYVALVDEKVGRNKVIQMLKKEGVQAQIGTYSLHIQPVYGSLDKCPVSKDIFNRAIALPFYYQLSEKEIDTVIDKLSKILG